MGDPSTVVELRSVRVGHPGLTVLSGVDATFAAGTLTALVGHNGAGKSTLLDAIAGVRPPLAGTITRASDRRPAYVVQRSRVSDALPITVRATVEMGCWGRRGPWRRLRPEDRRIVAAVLERLGLTDLADRPLRALSGGQRQRALVAQGLAQRSDLLLLDEPAAGLDPDAREVIDGAIADVRAEGVAVVTVTHDLRAAARADRCLVLGDGRVLADGTPAEALRTLAPVLT